MTWMPLGSLALPFHLNRHAVALRGDLARLSIEMTTGKASKISSHLAGDLGPLAALESRAKRIDAAAIAARSALTDFGVAQNALTGLADIASSSSSSLLAASSPGQDPNALQSAAAASRLALEGMRAGLATQVAGRALFSGTAADRAPLVQSEAIMAVLAPLVVGATSAAQVADAVDQAFLLPGGPFDALLYQGAGAAAVSLDGQALGSPLPTAADQAFRKMLSGLAMATFAGDTGLTMPHGQRQELARRAALTLADAGAGINRLQATLGDSEARVAAAQDRLEGERSALNLARSSLIGVDSFEAAGKLQEVQTRLEVLYAVTARTARLSLLEYIR